MADIYGRKKKPKQPPRPVEADDTLRSVQVAHVLDLISEGPIQGLVDGGKSVFFDDVPLIGENGVRNFGDTTRIVSRNGDFDQDPIPGLDYVDRETSVGIQVKYGEEHSKIIYDENVDKVIFRIALNGLSYRDDNGNVVGTSVELEFYAQGRDNVKVKLGSMTITGKASSRYEREISFDLPADVAPWKISVKRLTPDDTALSDRRYRNETMWDAYTERILEKLSYRYSALCAIEIDAGNFSGVPQRRYNIRGLKVLVPDNRKPDLEYGQTWGIGQPQYGDFWGGRFKLQPEWTRNPAWCLHDMVVANRYGLGQWFKPAPAPGETPTMDAGSPFVDKWTVYEIGKYCDELVPDGKGGVEPRFALHCYLQEQRDAYSLLSQLASVFRGMVMWANANAMLSADRPQDPVYLFTNSNVVNGEFSYSGTSKKSRLTAVYVSWNDPLDGYRRQVEYVEDQTGISRYGVNTVEINAFGCTSQGQARRVGLWAIYSSIYETGQIAFATGNHAAAVLPGQIVQIQDEHRNGYRWGGFIRDVGNELYDGIYRTYIEVDSDVLLQDDGRAYQLYFTSRPTSYSVSDAYGTPYTMDASTSEQRVVYTGDTTVLATTLYVASGGRTTRLYLNDLPDDRTPLVGGLWNLSEAATAVPVLARVMSVTENGEGQYAVVAVEHFPEKFNAIEQNLVVPDIRRNSTIRSLLPAAVTDVSHDESLYLDAQIVRSALLVSWRAASDAVAYRVRYSYDGLTVLADGTHVPSDGRGNITTLDNISEPAVTLQNTKPGFYTFEIFAINSFGLVSATPTVYQVEVFGKTAPPSPVSSASISATLQPGGIAIRWDAVSDLDIAYYVVKARPLDPGEFFDREELVAEAIGTAALYATAKGKGTRFRITVQSVDTSGVASTHVGSRDVEFAPPGIVQGFTVVQNLAYLDFYWRQVAGAVNYQIRAGQQWETAELLGETSSPQLSIEWGRTGEKTFWVRAYDALGNASILPAGETLDAAKPPTRNVVITNAEAPTFSGYKFNLEVPGVELQLKPGRVFGEYYRQHSLPYAHDVLVTVDAEMVATFESGLTWADMNFAWNDSRASQTWVKSGEVSQIDLEHYVAVDAPYGAEISHLWPLDQASGYTAAVTQVGTTVTTVGPTDFADGLFGSGLVVSPAVQAEFATAGLGAQFTAYFTATCQDSPIGRRLLRLTGVGGTWDLVYDSQRMAVVLRCTDGVRLDLHRKAQFTASIDDLTAVMRAIGFPYPQFGVFETTGMADVTTWLDTVEALATSDYNGDGLLGPAWQEYTTVGLWPNCQQFLTLMRAAAGDLTAGTSDAYQALAAFCSRALVDAGLTFSLSEGDMVFFAVSQFEETKVILGVPVTRQKRSVFVKKHGDADYLYGEVDVTPVTLSTLLLR